MAGRTPDVWTTVVEREDVGRSRNAGGGRNTGLRGRAFLQRPKRSLINKSRRPNRATYVVCLVAGMGWTGAEVRGALRRAAQCQRVCSFGGRRRFYRVLNEKGLSCRAGHSSVPGAIPVIYDPFTGGGVCSTG